MTDLMQLPASATTPKLLDLPDADMATLRDALRLVVFGFGSARLIVKTVSTCPVEKLTPRQRNALIRIGRRYRRQLSQRALDALARAT